MPTILKTIKLTDTSGEVTMIAKARSDMSNFTFWAVLDEDGELDLPFFKNQNEAERAAMGNSR
jgi:hypothetical protein